MVAHGCDLILTGSQEGMGDKKKETMEESGREGWVSQKGCADRKL